MVTALGVSVGLTARAIMARGTAAQKERWAPPLLTLEKIGAWAITEPGSGSDAFGAMKSTARRDGDGYMLNGSKTFITNGPYADTIVFICKLDDGNEPAGQAQGAELRARQGHARARRRRKPLRKMGLHSSPTGELFLDDVRVGKDRLIGETEDVPARSGAKDTFTSERTGVAGDGARHRRASASSCRSTYAKTRVQFGRPIGEFQLIQLKLAKMEVARMNIQNLVFRQIEMAGAGKSHEPRRGVGLQALLRAGRDGGVRSRRCSSSAATATWPSTASSSSAATPRCCRSTAAPTRSRSRRSRATCSPRPSRRRV